MSVLAQRFSNQFAAICNIMGGLSMSDGSLLPIPISSNDSLVSFIPTPQDNEIYNTIPDIWKNEKWETMWNTLNLTNQEHKKTNTNTTDSISVVLEESSRRIYVGGYNFIPCLRPQEILKKSNRRIPLLIITGSKDTMRDHCHFAYQMFLCCNYPVTLIEINEAEHEWILTKEEDIYTFLKSYKS